VVLSASADSRTPVCVERFRLGECHPLGHGAYNVLLVVRVLEVVVTKASERGVVGHATPCVENAIEGGSRRNVSPSLVGEPHRNNKHPAYSVVGRVARGWPVDVKGGSVRGPSACR
jgi:hypothetical protein